MTASASMRMLDPRPLGEDWQGYVGVSPYGALRRAWRVNALRRSDLRSVLGVTIHRGDDLYRLTLSSGAIKRHLSSLFPTLDTRGWDYQGWWPLDGTMPEGTFTASLRECPRCAESSYHSLLFQMPGVTHCPWHGYALISRCPRCDRPLQSGLREERPPGQCSCGHDLVSFVRTVTGDERDATSIQSYLDWAASVRGRYWLFAPEQPDPLGHHALDLLLPSRWRDGVPSPTTLLQDGRLIRDVVDLGRSLRHAIPRLSDKSGLETFNPATACLPIAWAPGFAAISRNLFAALPEAARRDASMSGTELAWTLSKVPVTAAGLTLFFQTECLERTTLRLVGRLATGVRNQGGRRRIPADDRFGDWIRRDPRGTLLLEQVLKRVLLRGYADGARVALGRHVPALYDRLRGRPATRYPWVLFHLPPDRQNMPSATIVWTRQAGTA